MVNANEANDMIQMWITEGTEGWWEAHGWRELRRAESCGVMEVLMEHDEVEEEEETDPLVELWDEEGDIGESQSN